MSDLWRIDELQALAAQALEATPGEAPESKRVRAIPDERSIRYYTTLGLIDRPAQMQGRTAFYGRRHVLQLVAIKRLQTAGLSLAEVQEKLAGATTRRLNELAELPSGFWEQPIQSGETRGVKAASAPVKTRESFWAVAAQSTPLAPREEAFVSRSETTTLAGPISCVRLTIAAGATLEITGVDLQKLNPQTTDRLRPALERLASELRQMGLLADESSTVNEQKRNRP